MVTQEIPGYTILRELGRGGMAVVYLARQEVMEREVALKLLAPGMITQENQAERFLRERKTVASLNHRNIVTVFDSGVSKGCYFLAMEYLTGGALEHRLAEQGKFPPEEAISIVRSLAGALQHAHDKGIVHRDIKPLNILFRRTGESVLTDFGIVKLLEDNQGLTMTGTTVGSTQYMSPEQGQGRPVDKRSDLYSLGIVFYQMLTGELPYQSDSAIGLVLLHTNAPIPKLPPELARFQPVIDKLVAKKPEDRFADCAAFIRALDRLKAGQDPIEPEPEQPKPQPAKPPQDEETQPVPAEFAVKEEPKSDEAPASKSRLGIMLAALAVVLVLVVGVVAYVMN